MAFVETLLAIALDAIAVALLGWTTWTAVQFREKPSARPFVALLATLTIWALCSLGSELPGASSVTLLSSAWAFGELAMALVLPGVWLVYALSYTGRGTGLTRRRIVMLALIVFPVLVVILVIAAGLPRSTIEYVLASMAGTELLYLFGLFVYATYLLVGLSGSHARVSKRQVAVLAVGVGAPYLVGAMGSGGTATNGVTLGLLVSGGLLAVSVRRYPVMTGFPKADYVARTRVVEALQEAVVVLDWEDHVLDANATTAQMFDRGPATIIGQPLQEVVDGLDRSDLSVGATGTVTLQTTKGRRQFQYSVSAVGDEETDSESGTNPVARAVLFRDVTNQLAREQRLTVLHRVLRHNVRNKLDVVLAHADHIEDEELQAGIRDSATDLVALSNKAREAEQIMTASTESPESVDLTDVATTVAQQYRTANPESEISLACPDKLVISSHRTVIKQVLSELVDNALTHTEASSPQVEISVREGTGAAAELSVADNGPGIPERERQILADGTERQLEHGQGIGLWFVNWAVLQLGGDLAFNENEPTGSVVTIRLYDVEYDS